MEGVNSVFAFCLFGLIISCTFGLLVALKHVYKKIDLILEKQGNIIESQRLSTILRLEPASLKISPEQFLANKAVVKNSLMYHLAREDSPQPDTRAFCILHHSGWRGFVDNDTSLKAQNGLARLLANKDKEGAMAFCEELVDKL